VYKRQWRVIHPRRIGMRVPRVQEEIKKVLGDKLDLGMHINSDESMALGAAFHGANISTAFRVRHVGMTDVNPWPITVSLEDLPLVESTGMFGLGKKTVEENDDEEKWSKHATVFKALGKIGVKKTIAFTHDRDVACALDYDEGSEFLPVGTNSALDRYNITGISEFAKEMEDKGLGKPKVSLQFELSSSGITQLVRAEAVVEEIITVEEEIEVEVEETVDEKKDTKEAEEKKESDNEEETTSADAKTEVKTEKKKKTEKKIVTKEKKKLHKKALVVNTYQVGSIQSYSASILAESQTKLQQLAQKDKERMMLEEARNKLESYIYHIKNKLVDDEEAIAKVSTEEQRETLSQAASSAEDWMYDEGYDADLATMTAKYEELAGPAEKIFFRVSEMTARPEAVRDLKKKLSKVKALMTKWEETKPQVTAEERADVLAKVSQVDDWLTEKVAAQDANDVAADPVFTSEEVPLQAKALEKLVGKLNKKPKPQPKKEEKKSNETEAGEEKSPDDTKESQPETENASESEPKPETTGEESEEGKAEDEL